MTEPNKCAHPACICQVKSGGAYGKYCSEYCKESADTIELSCRCQHPTCR
ncbi:MAG: hypothetical protein ABL961_01295 [Vicinamibacterales bacterium]